MKTKLLTIIYLCAAIGSAAAQQRRYQWDASLRPGDYAPHTLVVKYKSVTVRNGRMAAPSVRNNEVLKRLGAKEISRMFPNQAPVSAKTGRKSGVGSNSPDNGSVDLSTVYTIEVPVSQNLETAINILLTDPGVAYAEPLHTNFQPMHVPNDPLAQPVGGQQYWLQNIKAYEAWDVHKGSPNVTIGIIDFGCDVTHEDLKTNIQYNTADPVDGLDNDKDGYTDNYAGWNMIANSNNLRANAHGTRVSGCAAGEANNGLGGAGVGYNCRFLPATGFDPATGRFSGFAGLVYLAEKGCKVINLSWGRTGSGSSLEQDIINYAAINHDVVITASAGNDNSGRYWWPASYENVLSVGATDATDAKAMWSGGAGGSTYNDKVDIMAPGKDIISTQDGGGYQYDTGTSYASPMVAGAAALVRSLYPQLSAAEVRQRLVATTDDISGIAGNSAYAGKLGSGRLNVYRALTEPATQSVVLLGKTVSNAQNQPYLLPNTVNSLTVSLKNLLNPLTNATLTLTANSPLVTIQNAVHAAGLVNPGDIISNPSSPFAVTVSPSTLPNTEVVFTLTVADGGFRRGFSWLEIVQPDYLDIAVNQTTVTATSNGRLGYADAYSFWNAGIAANQQLKGNGIRQRNQPLLFEAGLVLATDADHVSDCVRNESPTYAKNRHFKSVRNVAFQNYPLTDVLAGGIIQEDWFHPARIGLKIQHQTYAWKDAPNDNFVIVEYKIKNMSGRKLDSLHAGLFADWEIGTRQNNQAGWDAARQLGYVFNAAGGLPYAGVRLLTGQASHHYAFDNQAGINIFDGFTAAEKLRALSGASRHTTAANADDVAHLLSARISNLADGDSAVVAFAIVTGNSIAEIQQTSDAARQKFIEINRSPKPVIANVQTCRGGRVMLAPSPGQTFRFYQKQSDGSVKALGAGSELALENVQDSETVLVTNTDSLYESEPVPVTISVFETGFRLNKDSLGIHDQDTLRLTDQTAGAVRWAWDFGDGNHCTEQNAAHVYRESGTYNVLLTTENAAGCRDTLVRQVRVFPGILSPQPVVQPITICAGDSVVLQPSNAQVFGFFNQAEELVGTGKTFNAGRIYRDTVFYVVATDYVVASQPVAVTVTVSPIKAAFTLAKDTLDLSLGETLQLIDGSVGAVKWEWSFGENSIPAKGQTPAYAYTKEGRYRITLRAENTAGCTDTASRFVRVVRSVDLLSEGIKLYPNPTRNEITVEKNAFLNVKTVRITVYGALGQTVYAAENIPDNLKLDLAAYGQGMYVVKFSGGGQVLTRKVVVY